MKPMLAAYTYAYNVLKIDYPIVESIQSSLVLADRVFVCDCESTDGTRELLEAVAAADNRVQLMSHPWGTHYRVQGRICNFMLERIEAEGYDYAVQVQADEVVCEWTVAPFLAELAAGFRVGSPKYRHFCPDYRTTWPFIYERKPVVTACKAKLRYDANSDGCGVTGGSPNPVSLELHHVGKVQLGRERQALDKEITFQQLYKELGFPDPKFLAQRGAGVVDYVKAFEGATFTPWVGPHPAALLPRIMRAEGRLP